MPASVDILTATAVSALVSFLGFWIYRRWAVTGVMLDHPGPRSSHLYSTPTGAGIVIIAAVQVSAWLLPALRPEYSMAIHLATGLGLLGFVDDRRNLPVGFRLLVQASLVCLFLTLNRPMLPMSELSVGYELGILAGGLLLLLWLINLFNFMDGIDGIASTQACFLSIAYLVVFTSDVAGGPLVLVAASAAVFFLAFNRAPATLFMGDSGSLFLGGLLAFFGALLVFSEHAALPAVLILWASFVADATVTLIKRSWRGEAPWRAHKEHFYQRLAQRLRSHSKVSILYSAVNILWLLPLALIAHGWPQFASIALIAAYLPLVLIASRW